MTEVTAAEKLCPVCNTPGCPEGCHAGPAFGSVIFDNAPDGACCKANFGGVYFPKPFIAYKRLDLRIAKTFKMPFDKKQELTFDFQAFNVFNWLNRTYSAWGAGSGSRNRPPRARYASCCAITSVAKFHASTSSSSGWA